MTERGKYIVIEGQDATGKSTQVELLRSHLAEDGIESIEFHEPGGTQMADEIRKIIKNGDLERDPVTNLLLFTAARHEIWQTARKALLHGTWVVAARNYYSTIAYQGYAQGVELDKITRITEQFIGVDYLYPDWAAILTLEDTTERERRLKERGPLETPDTFESQGDEFQQRINAGYISVAEQYNLPVISAQQTREALAEQIYLSVKQLI
jgi:dTMP kinase